MLLPGPSVGTLVLQPGHRAALRVVLARGFARNVTRTDDIPLADCRLRRWCGCRDRKGVAFTVEAIGAAPATGALLKLLRQSGEFGASPTPSARVSLTRGLPSIPRVRWRGSRSHAPNRGGAGRAEGPPCRCSEAKPRAVPTARAT